MLEINNQKRGSGKTTKVIELMRKDDLSLCLVLNNFIKHNIFPKDLQNRIIVATEIEHLMDELRTRKYTKLFVDELLYSRFYIARLFYELGRGNKKVIVYGTDMHS